MKNILIFTKEYQHELLSDCGGTGIFYRNLAEQLAQKGYNVIIFTVDKNQIDHKEGKIWLYSIKKFKHHFFYKLLRSIGKKLNLSNFEQKIHEKEYSHITNCLQLFITKNKLNIDVIETHDWEGVSLFFSKLNIPYVVRCHGCWTILEKYFNYKASNRVKKTEKKAFSRVKNIIFISEYNQKICTETFNISGTLIKNGVDISHLSTTDEKQYIPYSLFYFGNATPEKGFDIALTTFYKILKDYPQTTLHIIGRYNHKIIHPNIFYYGYLLNEKLIKTLNNGKIFLFPSKGETFGLALCETMAMGKVVIASDIPSFNNFIVSGVNGFIAKTPNDYENYIRELFNNEILQQNIGKNARESIIQNYNFDKTVQETINFYTRII